MDDPRDEDEHEAKRRERAYAIWERQGRPEGKHDEHWDEAGREHGADHPGAAPVGTQGERDARGGGQQPIPASSPLNPNVDA